MHITILTPLLFLPFILAAPTPIPEDQIALLAGGDAPNGPPPANISSSAIKGFTGANFLENMEEAFFKQGLQNLSAWDMPERIIEIVSKVHAQEQIHVRTIENLLTHVGAPTLKPCQYLFPVTTPAQFLSLANIITTAGLGAVINLASSLATTDPTLVPGPASILAIEARHDAFFRTAALAFVPNPTPFDTRLPAVWVLNLANAFVVPGSCPQTAPIFPSIPPLSLCPDTASITGTNVPITFTFDAGILSKNGSTAQTPLFIAWVNQDNLPVYTPATYQGAGDVQTIIPPGLAGMAFAALTAEDGVVDLDALAAVTLAGPAPVQIS